MAAALAAGSSVAAAPVAPTHLAAAPLAAPNVAAASMAAAIPWLLPLWLLLSTLVLP